MHAAAGAATVWEAVAGEQSELRKQGLTMLLTEETVRFATVKALVAAGVYPDLLRYEWATRRMSEAYADFSLIVAVAGSDLSRQ